MPVSETHSSRRAEYRIERRVEARGPGKVFVRSAASEAARPFLTTIWERERFAEKRFAGKARVIAGEWEGDSLVYPFLGQPTLEQQIGAAIEQGSADFGLSLVQAYAAFLAGLPSSRCVPSRFFDFLGCATAAGEAPVACVDFGPYDCIPRNLIFEGGGWTVLDLEWTFDFPIPVEFLIWRGVTSLVHALQTAIQQRASREAPVVLYRGFGRTRLYLPLAWFEALDIGALDVKKFSIWEGLFYRKVLSGDALRSGPLRLVAKPKVYGPVPKPDGLVVGLEELCKRTAGVARRCLNKLR
ncbi:MAG: hypothetical protein HYY24_02035 [Verrucomicrobia bacterium]|nr:hypothetical protein [Verrucomicrobiota bacterium]